MTAEATMAAVNVNKEMVLVRLLLRPLQSSLSGVAVGIEVGSGVTWLLTSLASERTGLRLNGYQRISHSLIMIFNTGVAVMLACCSSENEIDCSSETSWEEMRFRLRCSLALGT